MHPILFEIGTTTIGSYQVALALAFLVGFTVRRHEASRLAHQRVHNQRWIDASALVGAVVGAKIGMLLFHPIEDLDGLWAAARSFDFTGKTVIGGLAGGFVAVELTKKLLGVRESTGDVYAVALPLAQSVGRIGCFLNGCCYGIAWSGPWAIELDGVLRHPVQLYEAALNLALAAYLFATRRQPRARGHMFRTYLVGYAIIRLSLEPFRGDPHVLAGPLTLVQWVALATALGFLWVLLRSPRPGLPRVSPSPVPSVSSRNDAAEHSSSRPP